MAPQICAQTAATFLLAPVNLKPSAMAAPLPTKRASESGAGAGALTRAAVTALVTLLLLTALVLPSLVLHRAIAPTAAPQDDLDLYSEDERLKRVLRAAAMANNTVILTTLNSAWSEPGSVADIFLESFRIGEGTRELLDHLVIVSLDLTAHRRCTQIHRHCFALATDGVDFSGQKNYLTGGYLKMMWRRIDFLRVVLEKGYSFIFTDTDIVWFRNPLPRFYPDGDFQIACDRFNGDPDDLHNNPNGGFTYVRSSAATIEFYRFWYSARELHPGRHDQHVLNFIKRDPYLAEIGVRIKFLSTEFFGGLCQPSRNLRRVCTMHANCCIGLRRKIDDLNVMLQDWTRFTSLPDEDKHSASWTVPRNCSLKKLEQEQEQ